MVEYKNLSLDDLLKYMYDHASWYWIGMAYYLRKDFINAAKWLDKTMNDAGNEWAGKARFNLASMHYGGFHPSASKDEALRLFEKNLKGSMSNLYAGFLYFEGTETKHDIAKGKAMIEKGIELLFKEDGDDHYLSQSECYDIGWVYYKENNPKAYKWFEKCKARCNLNYQNDRDLIDMANRNIDVLRRDGVKQVSEAEEKLEAQKKAEQVRRDNLLSRKTRARTESEFRILAQEFREINSFILASQCEDQYRLLKYNRLVGALEKAQTEDDYRNIDREFRDIRSYQNSDELIKKCENQYLLLSYNRLVTAMHNAQTEREYRYLSKQFHDLGDYENAVDLVAECERLAFALEQKNQYDRLVSALNVAQTEADYQNLSNQFRDMNGFENTVTLASECEKRYQQLKNERFSNEYAKATTEMQALEKQKTREPEELRKFANEWNQVSHAFAAVAGFRDASIIAEKCSQQFTDLSTKADRLSEKIRLKKLRKAKTRKIMATTGLFLQLGWMLAFFYLLFFTDIINNFLIQYDLTKIHKNVDDLIQEILFPVLMLFLPLGIISIVTGLIRLLFGKKQKGFKGGFWLVLLMNIVYTIYITIGIFHYESADWMWPFLISFFVGNTIVSSVCYILFSRKKAALIVTALCVLVMSFGFYDGWFAFAFNRSMTIPEGVTAISDGEFAGNQLTGVAFTSEVTSIGNRAFSRNGLSNVEIPASITSIGKNAFKRNRLTSITIGANVTLEKDAFGSGFEDFYRNNGMMAGTYKRVTTRSNYWTLWYEDFIYLNKDGNITITGYGKTGNDVTIPSVINGKSVKSIGENAFSGKQLTSVSIPNSITSIGSGAFSSNQLSRVSIPNSVITIGSSAFSNNLISNLTISYNVVSIGASAFSGNQLTNVNIPDKITSIEVSVFSGNRLTQVNIPNSVTSIGRSAFSGNQITHIYIPNTVTSIGVNAFADNPVKSVAIGENVKIGSSQSRPSRQSRQSQSIEYGALGQNTGFNSAYTNNGSKAGTYTRINTGNTRWTFAPSY